MSQKELEECLSAVADKVGASKYNYSFWSMEKEVFLKLMKDFGCGNVKIDKMKKFFDTIQGNLITSKHFE